MKASRSLLAVAFGVLAPLVLAACDGDRTPRAAGVTAPSFTFPRRPFARGSIWRRKIPAGATYTSVADALTADPALAPHRAGVDLVTRCTGDPAAPLVNVERSQGWTYPARATSTNQVLYRRHLAPDACTDVSWNRQGNGLSVLLDPTTGRADLGIGGWRTSGGPLLNTAPDGPTAHGLDVRGGTGLVGYGRASGLPALGGLLLPGELNGHIRHPVAVVLPAAVLSSARHSVWPASSADATAAITYRGPNRDLAMGTLLAIPRTVSVRAQPWETPQGRNLAVAARRYGFYVVDVLLAGGIVQFGTDTRAARTDLGLRIDPVTGAQSVDPTKFDSPAFDRDVTRIVSLLRAVTSNRP